MPKVVKPGDGGTQTAAQWEWVLGHLSRLVFLGDQSTGDPSRLKGGIAVSKKELYTMSLPRIALALFAAPLCRVRHLSGSREQYFVCSYDSVWDAALDAMKGHSFRLTTKRRD